MNNQERQFKVIKEFISHYDLTKYHVGEVLLVRDINELVKHFEDRAGILLHHLQEIWSPAEELLKDIINYAPDESKVWYSSNRFNVDRSVDKYYMELDIERSYYSDDLMPVFKIEITKDNYEYLRELEKENGQ